MRSQTMQIQMESASKEELAKAVSELIRENEEVRMAIINLACSSPNIVTQI